MSDRKIKLPRYEGPLLFWLLESGGRDDLTSIINFLYREDESQFGAEKGIKNCYEILISMVQRGWIKPLLAGRKDDRWYNEPVDANDLPFRLRAELQQTQWSADKGRWISQRGFADDTPYLEFEITDSGEEVAESVR